MKIFEKKIYIGSIIGAIATLLGIIAVFFPNLFNMEKENFLTYSSAIRDKAAAEDFAQFLRDREDDGKLFKLDVSVCNVISPQTTEQEKEKQDALDIISLLDLNYLDLYYDGYPLIMYYPHFETEYLTLLYTSTKEEIIEYNNGGDFVLISTYYMLPRESTTEYDGIRTGSGRECGVGGIDIAGYFLFDEIRTYKRATSGDLTYIFEYIPEKEVKLRDY